MAEHFAEPPVQPDGRQQGHGELAWLRGNHACCDLLGQPGQSLLHPRHDRRVLNRYLGIHVSVGHYAPLGQLGRAAHVHEQVGERTLHRRTDVAVKVPLVLCGKSDRLQSVVDAAGDRRARVDEAPVEVEKDDLDAGGLKEL